MAITTVTKARKDQGNCRVCTEPIVAGTSYKWSRANRFVPKIAWHTDCPQPRPSVLEGNARIAQVMAAQEDAHDRIDELADGDASEITADDITTVLNECAEAIREVAGEYEEAAEAMGDGFGDETRERAETLNGAAEELDQVSIEERPEVDEEADDDDEDEDDGPLATWLADQIDTARSAIDDIEMP